MHGLCPLVVGCDPCVYCTTVLAKCSISDLNLFSCFENFQNEMVGESSTPSCQAHLQLGGSWLLVLEGSSLPADHCGPEGTRQPRRPWEGAVVLRQEGWLEPLWTREAWRLSWLS